MQVFFNLLNQKLILFFSFQESSRKIVACGKISTAYLFIPNITNTNGSKVKTKWSPIRPCHHETRQICLKKDGYIDLCRNAVNSSSEITNTSPEILLRHKGKYSVSDKEYSNLTEWWKEWNSNKNVSKSVESIRNHSRLCLKEAEREVLVICKKSANLSEACIEARSGRMKQCSSIKKSDMPINICIEVCILTFRYALNEKIYVILN